MTDRSLGVFVPQHISYSTIVFVIAVMIFGSIYVSYAANEDEKIQNAVDDWDTFNDRIESFEADPTASIDDLRALLPDLERVDQQILDLGGSYFIDHPSLVSRVRDMLPEA